MGKRLAPVDDDAAGLIDANIQGEEIQWYSERELLRQGCLNGPATIADVGALMMNVMMTAVRRCY